MPDRRTGTHWIKTEVKKARLSERARQNEITRAEFRRITKKPLKAIFREQLEAALKRIDPLEAAAILGGAVVVHEIIFKSADILSIAAQNAGATVEVAAKLAAKGSPLNFLFGFLEAATDIDLPFFEPPEAEGPTVETTKSKIVRDPKSEILVWAMAFSISYFAIKHGADLVGTAKAFLGLVGATA